MIVFTSLWDPKPPLAGSVYRLNTLIPMVTLMCCVLSFIIMLGGSGGGGDKPPSPADADTGAHDVNAGEVEQKLAERKQNRSLVRSDTPLSSKPSDYQIRVKIIEARSLQSSGMVDPICKVTIGSQRRHTRKQKKTFQPWFNEQFTFFFHEAPSKLFNEPIQLEVMNARRLRSNARMGAFSLDIGLVYEQEGKLCLCGYCLL